MPRRFIIPQMFDVRPVNKTGRLDWNKIREVEEQARSSNPGKNFSSQPAFHSESNYSPNSFFPSAAEADIGLNQSFPKSENERHLDYPIVSSEEFFSSGDSQRFLGVEDELFVMNTPEQKITTWRKIFLPKRILVSIKLFFLNRSKISFALAATAIFIFVGSFLFLAGKAGLEERILGVSTEGLVNLQEAVLKMKSLDFASSGVNFQEAQENFNQASKELGLLKSDLTDFVGFLPGADKLATGKNIIEAGLHLARAGQLLSLTAEDLMRVKDDVFSGKSGFSLLFVLQKTEKNMAEAVKELELASQSLEKVNPKDIPEEKKQKFVEIQRKLPLLTQLSRNFLNNSHLFAELLGGEGPRKYLFLFQNNHEIRATGGFIGSYALLDINQGRVKKFFIDEIFNPDGQLREKIVPPEPIQKISTNWSLHDSNWWPDFPVSARKAIAFYEKTGGPTVDGVIAVTPIIIERLLEVTGEIEMPEYKIVLRADNFMPTIQEEVEVNYDKELNRPKKILADLAPVIIDRLFNSLDFDSFNKTLGILSQGLKEKNILFYSENSQLQALISQQGWGGEIRQTERDYLSVINTNINGFKTDGVIDQRIEYTVSIKEDGSVEAECVITRQHRGGKTGYEWWDKVNANYQRLYVPRGSKLISVEGNVREFVMAPVNYDALGFNRDPEVEKEEKGTIVDYKSGTRIYEDAGKTVFANWTYVSPGETTVLRYKYLLPFKVGGQEAGCDLCAYSLLVQKQAGALPGQFSCLIKFPRHFQTVWNTSGLETGAAGKMRSHFELNTDSYLAALFTQKKR